MIIIVRTSLSPSFICSLRSLRVECIVIDVLLLGKTVRVCNFYRSPNSSPNHLLELLTRNKNIFEHEQIILLGDFNMPDVDWVNLTSTNDEYSAFVRYSSEKHLTQKVLLPTRGNNILDLLFTRDVDISGLSLVPPFSRSDHKGIAFALGGSVPESKIERCRNYAQADWDLINAEVFNVDWTYLLNSVNTSDAYNVFVEIIQDILTRNVPMNRNDPRTIYPLFLRRLYHQSRWAQSNCPSSRYAREKVEQYRTALRAYEIQREKRLVNNSNFKDYYKIFRDRLNPSVDTLPSLNVNNSVISSPRAKAEALSEFFSSVYSEPYIGPLANTPFQDGAFEIPNITVEMVIRAIKDTKNKVNTSPDGIPNVVYKKCIDSIAYPLAIIMQNSLVTGMVPEFWKKAIVKPVFKKGDKSSLDNYRPVSLTCSSSKIMEKVVIKHMVEYLESNRLLSPSQAGFREKRSTSSQMCETVARLNMLLRDERTVDSVFFDFRKAFDSIDHRLLAHKLKTFGFGRGITLWISNFLNDRNQKVKVDESFSSSSQVLSGVPQGSCIGPLLFILYINDIVREIPSTVFTGIYADDLKLFARRKHRQSLQDAINLVSEWSATWNMSFAVKKCTVMQYGKSDASSNYSLNGIILNKSETVRDLGILMCPNLLFDKHVKNIIQKAESRVNNIMRCFKCTEIQFLTKAFSTYVLPLLESASEVWNPTTSGLRNELEKVQRTFTRRVFHRAHLQEIPYPERLIFLGLENLEYRRSVRDLTFLFKAVHNLVSFDVSTCFTRSPLGRNLRNSHNLRLETPFVITAARRSTFSSRMIPLWNKLSFETVNSESLESFKSKIKKLPHSIFRET